MWYWRSLNLLAEEVSSLCVCFCLPLQEKLINYMCKQLQLKRRVEERERTEALEGYPRLEDWMLTANLTPHFRQVCVCVYLILQEFNHNYSNTAFLICHSNIWHYILCSYKFPQLMLCNSFDPHTALVAVLKQRCYVNVNFFFTSVCFKT